jgi:hypothetical protein
MTTFTNVALSNTFNEFRQAHNDVANTLTDLTTSTNSNDLYADQISANTGLLASLTVNNLAVISNLTSGRVVVAGASGTLSDDSGLTYNTSTDALTVGGTLTSGNVTTGGTLNVTGASTLTGNTRFGSGANNAVYYPANGSLILTSSGDASGTGRVDANHLHADWHVGAGGDVEVWATSKGDNADTHKIFAVANTDAAIDMLVVNQSNGANAYGEFIAIHATGNTADGWVSMGVNSSNYAEGAFGITKADDAYVLYSAPVNTALSGDLVIGTSGNGTGNKIIFSANGFDDPANNQQMVIHPAQKVEISIDTQSSNTTTGALVVNGGIGLRGNLNVGGNVAITGTITLGGGGNTVSTSSLSVDNPIVFLGANNAADVLDLGIVGEFTASGTKYAGLVRDASDSGIFKLFSNNSSRPANTVNFSDANVTYGTLQLGGVKAVSGTASSSNTTGALIVTGGIGLTGAINGSGPIRTTDTTTSTSTTTGALIVDGGVGIAGTMNVGGNSEFTGAVTITGPLRVQELVEDVVDVTASANAVTLNYTLGNVFFETGTYTGNMTINITNVPIVNGRATVITYIETQGSTGYYPTTLNVNGSAVTIKWPGGTAPTPTSSSGKIDIFTFTLVYRGSAFTCLASSALNF